MARGAAGRPPVEARVHDLDAAGRGVARVDGRITFIEDALPGEHVTFVPRRRREGHDEGRLAVVLDASPRRVEPTCPHHGTCGGCRLQHLDARAQVEHKERWLLDELRARAGVEPHERLDPVTGPLRGYRRKARLGARHVPGKGGVLVGFRERHAAFVADIDACEVLDPRAGRAIGALRALLGDLEARARIPQIEVALGDDDAALVIRHLDPLTAGDRERLTAWAPGSGFQVHLQSAGPASVTPLWPPDPPPLSYRLAAGGVEIAFRPLDFVQVNRTVNERLVQRVLETMALDGSERVLDLYCGVGNFSIALATRAAHVTGVEGSADLVARARGNAHANAVPDARFHAGDLDDPEVAARHLGERWQRLLLDPPRSGAAAVVAALRAPFPPRVVYVSCHPPSLARDAAVLVEKGYRLAAAGVVDMFPHTAHVESMAVFEHR